MQQRRGTMAQWADVATTVILASGEVGIVTDGADKGKFKVGDGTSLWNALSYHWSDANNALIYSKLVASQSFIGTQTFTSASTGAAGVIVKGATGQASGNIQEWKDPTGVSVVAAIGYAGALTVGTTITSTGALTIASGGTNTAMSVKSVGTGTATFDSASTGAVYLGNSANAKTITVGNVTGATGIVLNSGTTGITHNHLAGSQSKFVATAAPTSDMVTISNSGFASVTASAGLLSLTYVGGAAAITSFAQEIAITPGTTTGGVWGAISVAPSAAAATGVDQRGISFSNITAGVGTDTMIYAGTCWDKIIGYNGTTIIDGTGLVSAAQLTGTIPSAVLGNSSVFIGTTSIALNRASAALSLAGITLTGGPTITGPGGLLTLKAEGTSDHGYIQFYVDTDNIATRSGYFGWGSAGSTTMYVSNEMTNGPINLAPNGTGTVQWNGVQIARTTDTHYIGTTSIALNRASATQALTGITSIDGQAATVAQSMAIKFDTGSTEGTSLYTFNGGTAKTIDIKGSSTVTLTKAAGSVTLSAIGTATPSATAPASPVDNQLWYETGSGALYFRYNDGNTTQWVEVKATTTPVDTTYMVALEQKMTAFQIMGVL